MDLKKESKDLKTQCKQCNKEIPTSSAVTAEGIDYVWHFCGRKCHKNWQNKNTTTQR